MQHHARMTASALTVVSSFTLANTPQFGHCSGTRNATGRSGMMLGILAPNSSRLQPHPYRSKILEPYRLRRSVLVLLRSLAVLRSSALSHSERGASRSHLRQRTVVFDLMPLIRPAVCPQCGHREYSVTQTCPVGFRVRLPATPDSPFQLR